MYVRKIHNPSGSISVQVIAKKNCQYRMVKSFGSTKDPDTLAQLVAAAKEFAAAPPGTQPLLSILTKEDIAIINFVKNLDNLQIRTLGPELIFGALFDRIGFNAVPDALFRHITIARLAYPTSKLKTADYLYRYQGIRILDETIYRFLDRLQSKYQESVETIAYRYSRKRLGGEISVVFYDITTLSFEAEDEDDLRKIGYSKDGKFQHPQIMIGLLVGRGGFPIGYDIFEGNKFEGHTLVPTLEKISAKYKLGKPVVVADAAMLSNKNLEELMRHGYTFIVGGRIKNESDALKAEILKQSAGMNDGASFEIVRKDGTRLVVTYKDKRAKKDRHNREKGVRKLAERVKSGRLTKEHINNRGYNKFLALTGRVMITIDEDKVAKDARWDGLKGYVTNAALTPGEIVEHYGHLWQIEKAFRISKTDLRIRPVFHRLRKRIEAHLCIAFAAYAIYKELERLLAVRKVGISVKRAAELTHNMYSIEYVLPHSKRKQTTLLKMGHEQQLLYDAIHAESWGV